MHNATLVCQRAGTPPRVLLRGRSPTRVVALDRKVCGRRVKRAVATTYLHVLWVDGPTLRAIAEDFPTTRRSLRTWTVFNGLREYMLDQLRKASDGDREKKKQRQEKERRAIDSLRIANQGSASSEYKCGSCGSLRCTLYHTNSLGAVHLTSVPDMIVQCLDCEHRFTV